MNPLSHLRSLGGRFFCRSRTEWELQEELRTHIQLRIDDLERSGLDRTEAERRARIEFGSTERFKDECREALGGSVLDNLLQDLRFGARMLRKSPGFTVVAVLTIALGIGATTAIFSVVDATLLHPLPYPQPEELVSVQADLLGVGAQDVGISEPEWQDLQRSGIFTDVSPAWYDDNNLTGASRPARVSLLIVAPNYFSLLGVQPHLGRIFPRSDHSPGFTGEVIISDGLWKRTFGADPNILGRSIRLDTDLYQIVGVMPPEFHAPGRTARERNIEVWAATSFYGPPLPDHPTRSGRNLPSAIARLKPGLTTAVAQRQIDALVASLQKQFPEEYPENAGWKIRLIPLQETVVGHFREPLILLFAAAGLVLLIGCVNIANLLLARASVRGREIAIRQALGAARSRLVSQFLTESVLLSLLGGLCGVAILFGTQEFLSRLIPESLPRFTDIAIHWPVLLFATALSLGTGVIFGLAPALQLDRFGVTHALKQEGRGSIGSRDRARMRRCLVVTEFALSLVLMIAAGLLLHSFWDLLHAQLGFNPASVMTIKTRLPYPNDVSIDLYKTAAQQTPFFKEVVRQCRTLPGVEEVAMGDLGALPLAHDRTDQTPPIPIVIEGQALQSNAAPLVDDSIVTPEYFHLMEMPLLRGRLFNERDNEQTEPVAVINEAMAHTYWPNDNPLGQHVKLGRHPTGWTTIVGVVTDARTESLENPQIPQLYRTLYQQGAKHLAIFLRGQVDAAAIPEDVRRVVQSLDPTLPVFSPQSLKETVSGSLSQRRFAMEMLALFALTALLLAALGIYGVISYIVNERKQEIGIRLALGAQNSAILVMILRQGLTLAVVGAAVGLICALGVCRVMATALYGISPTDPITFFLAALVFLAVALLACYLPARRATKVNPIVALREA